MFFNNGLPAFQSLQVCWVFRVFLERMICGHQARDQKGFHFASLEFCIDCCRDPYRKKRKEILLGEKRIQVHTMFMRKKSTGRFFFLCKNQKESLPSKMLLSWSMGKSTRNSSMSKRLVFPES